jgi:hypothetical protein
VTGAVAWRETAQVHRDEPGAAGGDDAGLTLTPAV